MPRPEKVEAVAEIKERFENARAVFVTEYRGISVKGMGDLRRNLREAGADYKVVKMTLARLAVDEIGLEGIQDHLIGPTALAFADDDPVAAAKALSDYAKSNEALVIKLGLLAENILSPEDVAKLAEIEPREVLLAKIAGAAKAPLTAVASMLSSFGRDAATMFTQLLEKKEADPAAAEAAPDEAPEPDETPVADVEAEPSESPAVEAADDEAAGEAAEETADDVAEDAATVEESDAAAEVDEAPESPDDADANETADTEQDDDPDDSPDDESAEAEEE